MIPPASQTQWNPVSDTEIENPEAKNADADYEALLSKPLDLNSAKSAMGGIGKINPEDGKEIAETALSEEREESGNPDTDFNFDDAYNNFDQEEAPKLEEIAELEQIKTNGEYVPLFSKFVQEGKLTLDDLQKLEGANIRSENYESTIASCDINDVKKTALTESIQHLNNPQRIKQAQGELNEEFSDVFKDSQLESKGEEILWKSDFHAEAFSIISEHYMGGATKTPKEQKEDFNLALSMAAEDLGNKAKININAGNTEYYNKNLLLAQNMQAGEKERFHALANLAQIINHVEGVKGKGKQTELLKNAGKRKIAETGKFEDFQQQLIKLQQAKNSKNEEQIKKETVNLQKTIQDSGLSNGEATALIGGDLDMISETSSQNPTETA